MERSLLRTVNLRHRSRVLGALVVVTEVLVIRSTRNAEHERVIEMPSQNDNGDRRGPWGGGAEPGSDLEDLVRQGQDRVKQIMPSGGLRLASSLPSSLWSA